jgi:hypothetical protein
MPLHVRHSSAHRLLLPGRRRGTTTTESKTNFLGSAKVAVTVCGKRK